MIEARISKLRSHGEPKKPVTITIKPCRGPSVVRHLDALARLRISIFRSWPYLYDGDLQYESDYLRSYASDPASVLIVAFDGDKVIGASTAMPMGNADEPFRNPLVTAGEDLSQWFYFGESVLLPEYHGRGIGHRFFDLREHAAAQHGAKALCFCAVERASDHPVRPADARDLAPFWRKRGYVRRDDWVTHYPWREVGDDDESRHPMVFWVKK